MFAVQDFAHHGFLDLTRQCSDGEKSGIVSEGSQNGQCYVPSILCAWIHTVDQKVGLSYTSRGDSGKSRWSRALQNGLHDDLVGLLDRFRESS